MKYNISDIKNFGKGQFGINLVVLTSCDNKLKACGRCYQGRLYKRTLVTNVRLGCEYSNFVNAKSDDKSFESSSLKGMFWVEYPYIKQAVKSGKQYLSINYRPCDVRTSFESEYILDNKVLTKAEADAIISACFKAQGSGYSAKQAAAGVTEIEQQTKVVQYCLDDIQYLGCNLAEAKDIIKIVGI